METYFTKTLETYRSNPNFRIYRNFGNSSLVFTYSGDQGKRVRKLVTENDGDDREFQIAHQWYGFLNFDVSTFKIGRISVIDMPWLGTDLATLETSRTQTLDHQGYRGFGTSYAEELLGGTYTLLSDFYNLTGYVHTETITQNVLYHPELDFLPFIDAESFAFGSQRAWNNFVRNFANLSEFVFNNLVVN